MIVIRGGAKPCRGQRECAAADRNLVCDAADELLIRGKSQHAGARHGHPAAAADHARVGRRRRIGEDQRAVDIVRHVAGQRSVVRRAVADLQCPGVYRRAAAEGVGRICEDDRAAAGLGQAAAAADGPGHRERIRLAVQGGADAGADVQASVRIQAEGCARLQGAVAGKRDTPAAAPKAASALMFNTPAPSEVPPE